MSISDGGTENGTRVKGATIVKPIVYGNVAKFFGKKREEDGHTHQWTVYLRPYRNEDLSVYIKKVNFKLHESYANQNRVLTKPPFEVTETGWGEFEIVIKIYFHDPNERPVTLYHILKLFQNSQDPVGAKKPVISEFYEEIVFQEPTTLMHNLLQIEKPMDSGFIEHDTDFEDKKAKTMEAINEARTKVNVEINELKRRLQLAKETIHKFRDEVQTLQVGEQATLSSSQ